MGLCEYWKTPGSVVREQKNKGVSWESPNTEVELVSFEVYKEAL